MKLLNKINMKKLILIFFLLFSLRSYSQGLTLNGSLNSSSVQGTGLCNSTSGNSFLNVPANPVSYNQRAKDFFARVTALGKTLTDAQKSWYNDSIFVPLFNDGLIGATRAGDSLAALYSFSLKWAGDSTVANMNLLADVYNCIHYGGVTYTDSGVVGNGTTGYLNTFFIPLNDSSIYKLASASYGLYSKTNLNGWYIDMGVISTTSYSTGFFYARGGGNYLFGINGKYAGITTQTIATANSLGFYAVIRTTSINITGYKNGIAVLNAPNDTMGVVLCQHPFMIGAVNNYGTPVAFTTRCYPFAYIGSGLSAEKATALSNNLNNALKGRNYNVY